MGWGDRLTAPIIRLVTISAIVDRVTTTIPSGPTISGSGRIIRANLIASPSGHITSGCKEIGLIFRQTIDNFHGNLASVGMM